jgi:hypothetical protein
MIKAKDYQQMLKKSKPNKFGAKPKEYNGVMYDSTLEAEYAKKLDWLKKLGEIEDWKRQVKVNLPINGQPWRDWKLDFQVWLTKDKYEYHECKGVSTIDFQMKRDAFKILYPNEVLKIIKK